MGKPSGLSAGAIVGAAVRELRRIRGWTLSVLSEKTDISIGTLSRLETGKKSRVLPENVARLAAAFEVSQGVLDPKVCAARVVEEARTLRQRQLLEAVLSLPPHLAEEATEILAELERRARRTKR